MTGGPHRSRPIRPPPPDEPMPMTTARDRPPEEAAEDTSFARGLRVLLTIADRGEIRADELGTALDMSMSTVYRYLRTLTEFGFIERHEGGYALGPRLLIGTGANVSSEELDPGRRPVPAAARRGDRRDGRHQPPHRPVGGLPARDPVRPGAARHAGSRRQPARSTSGALARALLAYAPAEVLDEVARRRHRPAARAGRRPPAARRPPRDRRRRHRTERRRVHLRLRGHRRSHHPGRWHRGRDRGHRPRVQVRARVAGAGGPRRPRSRARDRRGAHRSRNPPDRGMRLSYAGIGTSRHLTTTRQAQMLRPRWTSCATSLLSRTPTRASRSERPSTGPSRAATSAPASGTWSRSARSAGPAPTRRGCRCTTSSPTRTRPRAPGFVHYFKGPMGPDGSCLSFCLWQSRADARSAAGRPAHVEAVGLLDEMYESVRAGVPPRPARP